MSTTTDLDNRGVIPVCLVGPTGVASDQGHIGIVGSYTPRVTATFNRNDEATAGAYTAGDIIANSTTAANVIPLTFSVARPNASIVSGKITAARCVITPASASLVITALDFDLLLFRPTLNIPFAPGSYPADNAALAVTAASFRDLVAVFSFVNTAWRNPAGGVTAGAAGYQSVIVTSGAKRHFNLADTPNATTLIGILQAQAAWTPTHIVNQFDFTLDVELD